jgi:hypothetical protein
MVKAVAAAPPVRRSSRRERILEQGEGLFVSAFSGAESLGFMRRLRVPWK